MTVAAPDRDKRNKAWLVLARQSDYLGGLAEAWRYGATPNREASRAANDEANALREVMDWLREID